MSWEKLAQNRIEEAIASGEFDELPGRGQPLDLTDYFSRPPTERAGVSLLKNAGVLPPEIELLKLAARAEEALTRCTDPAQRARLNTELQEHRVAFAMAMERRRRTRGVE
jgi:hypothetical protein